MKCVYWYSCKIPVILVISYCNPIFVTGFRPIHHYQISWKSFGGSRFVHGQMEDQTEGQRNKMKLQNIYRNLSKAQVRDEYGCTMNGISPFL